MPSYVLYCLQGSKLARCDRFEAADDSAAIEETKRRRGSYKAELWCEARRVKQFPNPTGEEPTSSATEDEEANAV
jgi:hypothetical protein